MLRMAWAVYSRNYDIFHVILQDVSIYTAVYWHAKITCTKHNFDTHQSETDLAGVAGPDYGLWQPCSSWNLNRLGYVVYTRPSSQRCVPTSVDRWWVSVGYWSPMMTSSKGSFSALLALCVGIHRSLVNSPHKGQWRGALMFSLICAWINAWVDNRDAGELRRHRAHFDVTVMLLCSNKLWISDKTAWHIFFIYRFSCSTFGTYTCMHTAHSIPQKHVVALRWWHHKFLGATFCISSSYNFQQLWYHSMKVGFSG